MKNKLPAFALRPNRIKHRDLWDIVWLDQQGLRPVFELIPHKLQDRKLTQDYFLKLFDERLSLLSTYKNLLKEYKKEIHRFLSLEQLNNMRDQSNMWSFIIYLISDLGRQIRKIFSNDA